MRLQLLFPQDLPHRAGDFGTSGASRHGAWSERETGRTADRFALLDRFFGVTRVAGPPSFLALSARASHDEVCRHVDEHGSSLGVEGIAEVLDALDLVAETAATGLGSTGAARRGSSSVSDRSPTTDPHATWRVGHLAFFPLIQGALAGLWAFMAAAGEDDDATGAAALRFSAACIGGSIRAMEFAADFSADAYRHEVRPSMAAPFLPHGLSGLMCADHHALVQAYPAAAWLARQAGSEVQQEYDGLVAVVESSYAAHVHVCDRFDGTATASLRMSQHSDMSASEVLARMGRSRVEVLRRED